MEIALLLFLILLNGVFAMSEMSLAASRKARLQILVEAGDAGAQAAMALHDNPTQFLSTVQIGITSIGVLNGIVGEAAFSAPFAAWMIQKFDLSQGIAEGLALAFVVIIITFLTIIFGELVPKRIGQMFPETVARLVARPMRWLSRLTKPFVFLLSGSTQTILGLMGLKDNQSQAVTEEEIAASLEEGVDAGVIEVHEHQMVRNVFRLDERQIGSMMIPRSDVAWFDVSAPIQDALDVIARHDYSRYPVCRRGPDEVLGVISAQQLLQQATQGKNLDLSAGLTAPVFVPETLSGMELLEYFRRHGAPMVFVVDEYGEVQGLITMRDMLEAIAGEFSQPASDDSWAVLREDGSWLMDGLIPTPELKDRLEIKDLPDEGRGRYNTLAGLIMLLLGRLPQLTDTVEWEGWRFEVIDLDGKRVDKVMVSRPIRSEDLNDPR
jgi:putative hemolysin